MTDHMATLAAELVEARGGVGGRCRVPDSLRRKVIDTVTTARDTGRGVIDVVEEIGLNGATFYRWLRELGLFDGWKRSDGASEKTARSKPRGNVVPVRVVESVDTRKIVVDLETLTALVARCG